MDLPVKPIRWAASSLSELRDFPEDARRRAGYELRQVQWGLAPSDFKPMKTIGGGVYEIRIHTALEHRVIYVARFKEAVYVLHAFEKKSRKTSPRDLEVSRRRLAEIIQERHT
jgi:phage-related protein